MSVIDTIKGAVYSAWHTVTSMTYEAWQTLRDSFGDVGAIICLILLLPMITYSVMTGSGVTLSIVLASAPIMALAVLVDPATWEAIADWTVNSVANILTGTVEILGDTMNAFIKKTGLATVFWVLVGVFTVNALTSSNSSGA